MDTARGYAMNTSPGPGGGAMVVQLAQAYRSSTQSAFDCTPWAADKMTYVECIEFLPDSATMEISTPCSYAMKPSTEKMAKPATKLVRLFNRHR